MDATCPAAALGSAVVSEHSGDEADAVTPEDAQSVGRCVVEAIFPETSSASTAPMQHRTPPAQLLDVSDVAVLAQLDAIGVSSAERSAVLTAVEEVHAVLDGSLPLVVDAEMMLLNAVAAEQCSVGHRNFYDGVCEVRLLFAFFCSCYFSFH